MFGYRELLAMQKYGDLPSNPEFSVDGRDKDLVLHAQLKLTENGYIMGSDGSGDLKEGQIVRISVELNSEEPVIKAWNLLKEGGNVVMDLQPTFFSRLHGSVQDKFGMTWMFTVM